MKKKKISPPLDDVLDGENKKGRACTACLGTGRVYCCESWEYCMTAMEGVELTWSHVLPHFPGTNMEMNWCPFCGRVLDRVGSRTVHEE